jgi:type II secretory pathway component GspD/PulD (secretin)
MSRCAMKMAALFLMATLMLCGALRAEDDALVRKIDTEHISLDFRNKPLVNVLQLYATLFGVEVHFQSCKDQGPISITLDKVSVRTSLNALSESAGFKWSLKESNGKPALAIECQNPSKADAKRILSPAAGESKQESRKIEVTGAKRKKGLNPYDSYLKIQFQKAELKEVLTFIAKAYDLQLLMDSDLPSKTVNMTIDYMYFPNFLDVICRQLGAKWKIAVGNPKLLIVEKTTQK